MTTTVIVKAHPADGRQLEVVVEAIDTNADGEQTMELARLQTGEERGDFYVYEGRRIVVSERPKK